MNPIRDPMILAALAAALAAPLPTQEQQGPKFRIEPMFVVRMPESLTIDLMPVLQDVLRTEIVFAEVVAAVTKVAPEVRVHGTRATLVQDITVLVPGKQAVVQLYIEGEGKAPAAEAIGEALRRQLNRLLLEPVEEDCTQKVHQSEQLLMEAKKQRDILAEREASLGMDDAAASQQTLFELRRQATAVELDLRTEQAVSEALQKQLATVQPRRADAEEALRAVQVTAAEFEAKIVQIETKAQATGPTPKEAEAAAAAQQMLVQQRAQLRRMQQTLERCQREEQGLEEQVTASALLLQRHLARRHVLLSMLDEHQRKADEAAMRARQRRDLQRDLDRTMQVVDRAESECAVARQRLQTLLPVQVSVWK